MLKKNYVCILLHVRKCIAKALLKVFSQVVVSSEEKSWIGEGPVFKVFFSFHCVPFYIAHFF